jgi:hypothetical protein
MLRVWQLQASERVCYSSRSEGIARIQELGTRVSDTAGTQTHIGRPADRTGAVIGQANICEQASGSRRVRGIDVERRVGGIEAHQNIAHRVPNKLAVVEPLKAESGAE